MILEFVRRLYTPFWGNFIRETRFERSPQFFVCTPCEMHKVATPNFVHKNRNRVSPAIFKTNIPRTFEKSARRNLFYFNVIFSCLRAVIVVASFIYLAALKFLDYPHFKAKLLFQLPYSLFSSILNLGWLSFNRQLQKVSSL